MNFSKLSSLLSKKSKNPFVSFIGAPFSGGQPKKGTELGPKRLREYNVVEIMKLDTGLPVEDCGDVEIKEFDGSTNTSKLKNVDYVSQFCKSLHKKVREESERGGFALTIGGDHSIAIGSISGVCSSFPDTSVIWVDAHADINTYESTISGIFEFSFLLLITNSKQNKQKIGNMHGMPVSFLLGFGQKMKEFEWLSPCLSPERICFIGLRDLDPLEKLFLKELKIKSFWAEDVERMGIREVTKQALEAVDPEGKRPLHMSFDVDAIDPLEMPSTGTAVRGGLSLREGKYICESLYRTNRLVGLDLVEINPLLGNKEQVDITLEASTHLILSALGKNCER